MGRLGRHLRAFKAQLAEVVAESPRDPIHRFDEIGSHLDTCRRKNESNKKSKKSKKKRKEVKKRAKQVKTTSKIGKWDMKEGRGASEKAIFV